MSEWVFSLLRRPHPSLDIQRLRTADVEVILLISARSRGKPIMLRRRRGEAEFRRVRRNKEKVLASVREANPEVEGITV